MQWVTQPSYQPQCSIAGYWKFEETIALMYFSLSTVESCFMSAANSFPAAAILLQTVHNTYMFSAYNFACIREGQTRSRFFLLTRYFDENVTAFTTGAGHLSAYVTQTLAYETAYS